ncbi:MAG: hypothetical protein HKO92_02375 [Flavobacteriaceae bacterium]|nr:hypothetical protein [Flavobacteriaceae bacterium]
MNILTSTIYNSISELKNFPFEGLNTANNTYFTKDFLYAFENSNPEIDFKYIAVFTEEKSVALALIQTIEVSIEVILKNTKMPSFLRRILYSLFCKDHLKIMFCGNIFLSGEHGILIKDSQNKVEAINRICKEINAIAKQTKPLHAIFIKDFIEASRPYTDHFKQCGFTPMHVEPNMIISLKKEWNNFDNYKQNLKSKYRVKVNKADNTSADLEARLLSYEDLEYYKNDLQKLYENTIANADFNAQVLNLNTYIKLKSAYKENFIVKAYFLKDKIVGFLSALANNQHLDAHFIGLDYSLNKEYAIYPRILNDYVRLGIEKKSTYINLGRTASEIKTTIGAEPVNLTCYLKHKRPWVNRLIRPFVKRVQLKDFKQHVPFKE